MCADFELPVQTFVSPTKSRSATSPRLSTSRSAGSRRASASTKVRSFKSARARGPHLADAIARLGVLTGDFTRIHGFHKPTKGQQIIFYCRSGKRSTTAIDLAKRAGFRA